MSAELPPVETVGISGLSTPLYVLFGFVAFFVVMLLVRGVTSVLRGRAENAGRAGRAGHAGSSDAYVGPSRLTPLGAVLTQIGLTLSLASLVSAAVLLLGYAVHAPELTIHVSKRLDWPLRSGAALAGVAFWAMARPWERWRGRSLWEYLFNRDNLVQLWWTGAELGVLFGVLTLLSALHPVPKNAPFKWGHEIVHFGALFAGVPFLLVVLAALIPVILDGFEGRSFSSFVGARHVRATKSGFLTAISLLSMGGVAVSSCALCSVTSIMGGFGHDLKRKLLANNGHIVVDVTRPGGFGDWQEKLDVTRKALARAGGGAATPVAGGEAMASSASNTAGALVKGIDPATIGDVIELKDNILYGKFDYFIAPERLLELSPDEVVGGSSTGEPFIHGPDFRNAPDTDPSLREFLRKTEKVYPGVIIGKELARSLHVLVGDEISCSRRWASWGRWG